VTFTVYDVESCVTKTSKLAGPQSGAQFGGRNMTEPVRAAPGFAPKLNRTVSLATPEPCETPIQSADEATVQGRQDPPLTLMPTPRSPAPDGTRQALPLESAEIASNV
jgi:hypothetical protein